MRSLIVLFLVLFSFDCKLKANEQLIERLYEIIALEESDPDSAFVLSNELLKEGELDNDSLKISYASFRLGNIYFQSGKFQKAIPQFKRSFELRIKMGDYVSSVGVIELIAKSYYSVGRADSAFVFFTDGLRLLDKYSAEKPQLLLNIAMAKILMNYDDLTEARYRIEKAEDLLETVNEIESKSLVEQSWGVYYYYSDSISKAVIKYKNAYLLDQEVGDLQSMINNCNNLALCYTDLEQYDLALFYYRIVLDHYSANNLEYKKAITQYNTALCFRAKNELDSAVVYLQNALLVLNEYNDFDQTYECMSSLVEIYLSSGKHEKASKLQESMLVLKDSILDAEKISSIAEYRTVYETEKKEQKIALLNAQAEKDSLLRNLILAISISAVLALFLLINRYRQNLKIERSEKELSQKKVDLLLGEQELKLYNALLSGQEKERKRISRDLHDQVGSMLSALKFKFTSALKNSDEKGMKGLDQMIDSTVEEVRRISHDLDNVSLSSFGLNVALTQLCNDLDQLSDELSVNYHTHGLKKSLDPQSERELYKICQEILNNMLKHSKATKINLDITFREDAFSLTLEDNGVGFDPSIAEAKKGLGLKSIQERAKTLGAQMYVDSSTKGGSSFQLELPLNT